jgi:hypothetical protein
MEISPFNLKEVEFYAEDTLVDIVPNFSGPELYLITVHIYLGKARPICAAEAYPSAAVVGAQFKKDE